MACFGWWLQSTLSSQSYLHALNFQDVIDSHLLGFIENSEVIFPLSPPEHIKKTVIFMIKYNMQLNVTSLKN